MIAACPKCSARYRIERERLGEEGVRLRCQRCEAVFRVRPPVEAQATAADSAAAPFEAAPAPAVAPAPVPAAVSATPPPLAPVAAPAPSPVLASPARAAVSPAPTAAPLPTSPRRPPVATAASPAATAEARAPAEPAAALPRVLVGAPDADVAKETAAALARIGLEPIVVHDGVEAMLEIQRKLPCAVVLWASLPRMFGFQICEIVKRNESLRGISVLLVGEIHDNGRYRRPPNELYGADAYIEEPDVPEGLPPLLERLGVHGASAPQVAPAAPTRVGSAPAAPEVPSLPRPAALAQRPVRETLPPAPLPEAAPVPAAAPPAPIAAPVAPAVAAPVLAPAAPAPRGDGLDDARAQAARLARIIVSDIVLYNEGRFVDAVRRGDVLTALEGELAEGRSLFRERVDERVRNERDYLGDELLRVARSRGLATPGSGS